MSDRNKKKTKKGGHQRKYEDRPLTDRPFAAYFKRTRAGQAWVSENLPKEKSET